MKYESIAKRVTRRYRAVEENGTYFFNKAGNVVAYENSHKNLIVMYVKQNDAIWCHYGIVAVAIAKDFVLTKEYQTQKADVVVINGLCGACNSIERISNRVLAHECSKDLIIDCENSFEVCEPVTIIDRGILDSPQFASCNLSGACIDVKIKDAKGKEATVPYIVGKGLAYKAKQISTMGYITSSNKIHLDTGIEIDVSALFNCCDVSFDFDNMVYGVLAYKRTGRKKLTKRIAQKDYDVFQYLRKKHSWYWEQGYDTRNSDKKRAKINMTANGTNYHEAIKVTCN